MELSESHPKISEQISSTQAALRGKAEPLFVHRHKFLAHRDLNTIIEPGISLPGITWPEVTELVYELGAAHNWVVKELGLLPVDFSREEAMDGIEDFLSKRRTTVE